MKRLWRQYAERLDALSLRERVMVFAAAMAVLVALVHTLFIDAEVAREKRLSSSIAQKQSEMKALQDQIGKVVGARAQDPDRAVRERLALLKAQLSGLEEKIAAEERRFTAPSQMRKVIGELVARNRGVRLLELKTLPATTIAESREAGPAGKPAPAATPAAKPAPASERLIYRHGVDLTVSGPYLDLLAYLRDLEQLPTQLYWGALDLDASAYPKLTMKLTVYTLSLDRAWLDV